MLRLGFFVTLILAFASLSQAQDPTTPPDLVIELFRHGARAPLRADYAEGWFAYEYGQLTPVGLREHYVLGRALANEYPDILGQPYNLSKIYLRSSVTDRSVDSALSQMYGIYEGRGPALNANPSYPAQRANPPYQSASIEQITQNLTNAQAVQGGYVTVTPNTTSDEGGINLIEPSTVVCLNLVNNILENVLSDQSTQFWEDLAPTRQALQDAGITVNNPLELGVLGDVFVCNYDDDRPLPGNIDPQSQVYTNITFARNWYFVESLWGAPQQRQLLSVPLYNYIFSYFDRKAAGSTDFEFIFLSTAETNLIHLLATLDIVTADCLMTNYRAQLAGQPQPLPNCNYTEFASNIIIEFYNNNGSPNIIFKYNGVAIPVCSGNTVCPYADFKNLVSQATNGYTVDYYNDNCLEDSLPLLQRIAERAGFAFEAKENGVTQDIASLRNEITGGDDANNAENTENGEDQGFLSSTVSEATQDVRSDVDSTRQRLGSFFGGN